MNFRALSLLVMPFVLAIATAAQAGDCKVTVSDGYFGSEAATSVLVAHDDGNWMRFEIPKSLLPLQAGLDIKIRQYPTADDYSRITYDGRTLTVVSRLYSNFTKDTTVVMTDENLQNVIGISWKRYAGLVLPVWPQESFECTN